MEMKEEKALENKLLIGEKEALELVQGLMDHFSIRATRHKRQYRMIRYASIFLALTVTILSTLELVNLLQQSWLVPIIASIATILTSLLSITNAQKQWLNSRTVYQKLQTERFLYKQSAGIYKQQSDQERVTLFSEKIVDIWNSGHEQWQQFVQETASKV